MKCDDFARTKRMKIFCSSLFIIGGWLLVDQIRHNDAVLGRWMCVAPLAEKYLNIGSYLYCVENPVKLINTDGKDIFLPGNKKDQDAYVKMLYTSNLQLSP